MGHLSWGEVGDVGGTLGQDGGTVPGGSLCLCPRLLHSLTNLKRVIINAAHYLVLGDKDAYRHDPAAPFLGTVSSTLPCGSPCPSTVGHAGAAVPVPPGSTALPAPLGAGWGPGERAPACACVPGPGWQGWWAHHGSDHSSPQDDVRPNQDSLPERTVVKLDAVPR